MDSRAALHYPFKSQQQFSRVTKFLWWCCGADKNILARCTFADHVKYACLGGIVFATGLLAAIAGGFAFYIIFSPKGDALNKDAFSWGILIASLIFGTIWGNIIFNLDRYIVASTGKGDGTEKITKTEFLNALPRIFMGAIIALTISKPLEIRIFKSEIDAVLEKKQNEYRSELDSTTHKKYDQEIGVLQAELDTVRKDESVVQQQITFLQNQYVEEVRNIAPGPRAAAIKIQLDDLKNQLASIQLQRKPKTDDLVTKIKTKQNAMEDDLASNGKIKDALDGLMERIKISHELSPTISLLITLLFLAIELTPIFFKLMVIKGPYDYLEENTKELIVAMEGIHKIHTVRTDKKGKEFEAETAVYYSPEKLILEKGQLLKAQIEISEKLAERWKIEQIGEIDKQIDESKRKFEKPAAEEVTPDDTIQSS